jgi:transposase
MRFGKWQEKYYVMASGGRIEQMLPGKKGDRGQTAADNRLIVEAVLWLARTGSPWRDLPGEFGFWNSAYKRFARWSDAGVWQRVFVELCKDADFEGIFTGRTIVKVYQHAAGTPKKRATKHLAVYQQGTSMGRAPRSTPWLKAWVTWPNGT